MKIKFYREIESVVYVFTLAESGFKKFEAYFKERAKLFHDPAKAWDAWVENFEFQYVDDRQVRALQSDFCGLKEFPIGLIIDDFERKPFDLAAFE